MKSYLVYTPATTTLPAMWIGDHGCWVLDMERATRFTMEQAESKAILYTGFATNIVEVEA